jgi:hypothetical protein
VEREKPREIIAPIYGFVNINQWFNGISGATTSGTSWPRS